MTRRVLVCDDHPLVRDAISIVVREIAPSAEITVCGTMRQAVERLAQPGWFDLVVLDLGLPDAHGIEALIRVRGRAPSTKVAVLSASDDADTVDRAMRAGASAFVAKSADPRQLFQSLRTLLGEPEPVATRGPATIAGRSFNDALDGDTARTVRAAIAAMTARQLQVLRLMLAGLPNKEIADSLGLSGNTVKVHIGGVLRALGARNRTDAVARATRAGLGAGH